MVGGEERVGFCFLIPRREKKKDGGMENVLDRVSTIDGRREIFCLLPTPIPLLATCSQFCNPPDRR